LDTPSYTELVADLPNGTFWSES